MILAVDVHYRDNQAHAAALLFAHWDSADSTHWLTRVSDAAAPYQPGAFYQRELPPILALLAEFDIGFETIVVDGYVELGSDRHPGLGLHLYRALDEAVPVIGVAKNRYRDTPAECELLRGRSRKPLYVTAAGMILTTAKAHIAAMHGTHRIPTLLRRLDQLTRLPQTG